MPGSRLIGVVVDHEGLDAAAVQSEALEDAGATSVIVIAPMTSEDWFYKLRDAVAEAEPGDAIAVTRLHHLGLSVYELFANLGTILGQGLGLVVLDPALDSRSDPAVAATLSAVLQAADEGGLVRVKGILAGVDPHETKSPPKARLVDAELYRKAASES